MFAHGLDPGLVRNERYKPLRHQAVLLLLRSYHPFISVQQFRRIGHAHPDNDNRQTGDLYRPTGRLFTADRSRDR